MNQAQETHPQSYDAESEIHAERVNEAAADAEAAALPAEDAAAQIEALTAQLQDEKLRAAANEQNLRRRHQEELQAAHKFAAQKFASELLAVKDYLEMALQDQSGNFEALKMGVDMTLVELNKAFEKEGITEIAPQIGDKLDPHLHQAMQQVESDLEPNAIVSVLKKGYLLSGRVLRPAMVTVARAVSA